MQNIILTGFMGTGKSTVGRLLAVQLAYQFVDTDEWIVAQNGRSIATIFAQFGEATFRQWEARAAQTLATERELVIATGGGLMLNPDNEAALAQSGLIICLTAQPDTILARIQADETKRPLLNQPDPAQQIEQLLQERAAVYGRFPQIPTDNQTPAQIAAQILDHHASKLQPTPQTNL